MERAFFFPSNFFNAIFLHAAFIISYFYIVFFSQYNWIFVIHSQPTGFGQMVEARELTEFNLK